MRKKLLFLLFIIFMLTQGIQSGYAQAFWDRPTSFLKTRLAKSKPDTGRVSILLALSRSFLFRPGATHADIDSAEQLFKQAALLNHSLHDQKWEGNTALMATLLLNHTGKREQALLEAQKALAIFRKINDLSDQAEAYILIGQHYGDEGKEMDQKLSYYQKAVDLFLKTGFRIRAATTLKDIGEMQMMMNKNAESLKILRSALAIYKSANYKELQGVYDLMGYDLTRMGDYVSGLKYGLLALKTAEAVKDTSLQLCTILNRVGLTYGKLNQYNNTSLYCYKALSVARKYHDTASITIVSFNIISTLVFNNKYKEALAIIQDVDKDSGPKRSKELDVQIAYVYLKCYLMLNQFGQAGFYFNRLRAFAGKIDGVPQLMEMIIRGTIFYYQQTGKFEKSYRYIREHETFCTANNLAFYLNSDELWWFKADSALKKYPSAIRHYQRYKTISDSVVNDYKGRQISLLEVQYETDRKNEDIQLKAKDIQLLLKKEQLQDVRSEQDKVIRNIILIGAAMLVLLLLVGYNRYRLKQRSNQLLEAQQAEINRQNQSLLILDEKKTSLLKEKEWLLREIHHRVKNNLQITMSLLNIQSGYMINNDALEAIQHSQRRMQAMSLIHQKLYQSDNLALIDMAVYIPELVTYLKESFDDVNLITFDLQTPPLELDIAQAVPLGLILNEAITNAIKYAFPGRKAGKIHISINENGKGCYTLIVADDGVGLPDTFDPESHDSLGMNLMRGLTAQLQGEFKVQNQGGTKISVVFASVNLMEEELYQIENEA